MRDDPHDCVQDTQADEPLLDDFLAELASWGVRPAPAPTPALLALLGDTPPPSPTPGHRHDRGVRATQTRRKRNMLTTKLAGLGLAAKVALGAGIAAAAVGTAGATGVLPAPAQHAVASVVDAVTPLNLPDPTVNASVTAGVQTPDLQGSTTTTVAGTHAADDTNEGTDDTTGGTGTGGTGTGALNNHGACVSAVAHDNSLQGRDHGKAVSSVAKSDCGKTDASTTTSSTSSTSTSTSTTSTTVGSGTAAVNNSGHGQSGEHGNGGGNGNGNSGKK
jgi:hypothetical protein